MLGGFLFSQAGLLVLVVALVFCRVVSAVAWAGSVVLLYWCYLFLRGSLLCWDGDVGSSRLVLWAGRLKVTLLSGLNISCVFCCV